MAMVTASFCATIVDSTPKEPVSDVLQGMTVCVTGFKAAEKDEMLSKVQLLGGVATDELTSRSNFLIAQTVGSEKYKCAVKLGIPVVKPEWLDYCWENRDTDLEMDSDRRDTYKDFLLPIFAGCRVCTSGFHDADERELLRKYVEDNGGQFDFELMKSYSHLIAMYNASGKKYNMARKWGLFIVSKTWVTDSIEMEACADESLYKVREVRSINRDDSSSMDSHAENDGVRKARSKKMTKVDSFISEFSDTESTRPQYPPPESSQNEDAGESFTYFDGYRFYLGTGFSDEAVSELKNMILEGGGNRARNYSSTLVTHFVLPVGKPSSSTRKRIRLAMEDVQLLKNSTKRPVIVSHKWLRACSLRREVVDCTGYVVDLSEELSDGPGGLANALKSPETARILKGMMGSAVAGNEVDPDDDGNSRGEVLTMKASRRRGDTTSNGSGVDSGIRKPKQTYASSGLDGSNFWDDIVFDMHGDGHERKTERSFGASKQGSATSRPTKFPLNTSKPTRRPSSSTMPAAVGGGSSNALARKNSIKKLELVVKTEPGVMEDSQNDALSQQSFGMESRKRSIGCDFVEPTRSGFERDGHNDKRMHFDKSSSSQNEDTGSCSVVNGTLFAGMVFRSIGFTEAQTGVLGQVIISQSGIFNQRGGYLIVPVDSDIVIQSDDRPRQQQEKVVTDLWVDRCLQEGKVWDIYSRAAFRPLRHPRSAFVPDFGSLSFSVTGYDDFERLYLEKLVRRLGGSFTLKFSKKQNYLLYQPGLSQTNKFAKAVEWGVKVVRMEWLERSALVGRMVDVSPYIVTEESSPSDVLPPMPTDFENSDDSQKPQFDTKNVLSELMSQSEDTSLPAVPSTDHQPHPLIPSSSTSRKQVTSSTPAIDRVKSSDRRESLNGSPLDQSFSKHLGNAIQTTEKILSKSMVSEPGSLSLLASTTMGSASDACNEDVARLLKGCVVCMSSRLQYQSDRLRKLAISMGADFRYTYSDHVTHYIHQGKPNDNFGELRTAKKGGKFIVSPAWLEKTRQAGRRLPERDFPFHASMERTLSLVSNGTVADSNPGNENGNNGGVPAQFPTTAQGIERVIRETSVKSKTNEHVTESLTGVNIATDASVNNNGSASLAAAVEHFMSVALKDKPKPRARRYLPTTTRVTLDSKHKSSSTNNIGHDESMLMDMDGGHLFSNEEDEQRRCDAVGNNVVSGANGDGGGSDKSGELVGGEEFSVVYDDPEARREKNKLFATLLKNKKRGREVGATSSKAVGESNIAEEVKRPKLSDRKESREISVTVTDIKAPENIPPNMTSSLTTIPSNTNTNTSDTTGNESSMTMTVDVNVVAASRPASSFKFLLSGFKVDQKHALKSALESLGATVSTADCWSDECTHLVINKPNRSEKCLAACTAGRWILKPDYVTASAKAGVLLDEERYEWGKTVGANGQIRASSKDKCCTFWRQKGGGAFKGWKVFLIVDAKRKDGFVRLLEAGGAEVEVCRQVRSMNLLTFTHVLIDSAKQKPIVTSHLEHIRAQTTGTGTRVMDVNFIADYVFALGNESLADLPKYDVLTSMLANANNNGDSGGNSSTAATTTSTKRTSKK